MLTTINITLDPKKRIVIIKYITLGCFSLLILRLAQLQLLSEQTIAVTRSSTSENISRGNIYAHDGSLLVEDTNLYSINIFTPDITTSIEEIYKEIEAWHSENNIPQEIVPFENIATENTWIPLIENVSAQDITSLPTSRGITPEKVIARKYTEGSLASQLLGYVANNDEGNSVGFFGIEGYYNEELTGNTTANRKERDIHLAIRKNIQVVIEQKLEAIINEHNPESMEIVIMDPFTGDVYAMFGFPNYDATNVIDSEPETHKIPAITHVFEPGSIFKPLVMAAGIDSGVVTEYSQCWSLCEGPVTAQGVTIKNWDEKYRPGINMTEVLINSDNTGMMFVQKQLGEELLLQYLNEFGIGKKTGIDLEAEWAIPLREDWSEVDLLSASFGQGVATSSIQMLTAFNSLGNGGVIMEPHIVEKISEEDEEFEVEPKELNQVVSNETSRTISKMMWQAANEGVGWDIPKELAIAGKTGTAQIAKEEGGYDEDKTIASYVGYWPYSNPKVSMIVKLVHPKSSEWASQTAAPIWFDIARDIDPLL